MKVRELMKIMSTRRDNVSPLWILDIKLYLISMYRAYMVMLYDYGYISDPTSLDKIQVYQNIYDMGIVGMTTNSGRVCLSSEQVEFSYYKNKDKDDSVLQFLNLLHSALLYREEAIEFDKFFEHQNINLQEKKSKIKIDLQIKGSNVFAKGGYRLGSSAFASIYGFSNEIEVESLNPEIWNFAMKELGIPEDDWDKDGILDGALTHQEEVNCAKGILSGVFKISNGKYTHALDKWMAGHKWGKTRTVEDSKSLYDFFFYNNVSETLEYLEYKMNDMLLNEKEVIGIVENCIFYKHPRESLSLPIGEFALVCDKDLEEYLLPTGNSIYGYTGELYTRDRLEEQGSKYCGCPISLFTEDGERGIYYDLEQTDISSQSWFEDTQGVDIIFSEEDAYSFTKPAKRSNLFDQIFEGYTDGLQNVDSLVYSVTVKDKKDLDKELSRMYKIIEGIGQ